MTRTTLVDWMVLAVLAGACRDQVDTQPFSRDAWQQSPPGSDARYAMARDLVASKTLIGLPLADVEVLLGNGGLSQATARLAYALGGRVDSTSFGNTLVVELDARLVVRRAFIYRE